MNFISGMLKDIINDQLRVGNDRFVLKWEMTEDMEMIDILTIFMKFKELDEYDCYARSSVRGEDCKARVSVNSRTTGINMDKYLFLKCVMLRKRCLIKGPTIRDSEGLYRFTKDFFKNAWETAVEHCATHTAFGKFILEFGYLHSDDSCISIIDRYLNPQIKSARNI